MHPANFHSTLAAHYQDRMNTIIASGKQYTPEYFFVKKALAYHSKQVPDLEFEEGNG